MSPGIQCLLWAGIQCPRTFYNTNFVLANSKVRNNRVRHDKLSNLILTRQFYITGRHSWAMTRIPCSATSILHNSNSSHGPTGISSRWQWLHLLSPLWPCRPWLVARHVAPDPNNIQNTIRKSRLSSNRQCSTELLHLTSLRVSQFYFFAYTKFVYGGVLNSAHYNNMCCIFRPGFRFD